MLYQITIAQAVQLMANFINHPDLCPKRNSIPIGGTLTSDVLFQSRPTPPSGIIRGRRGWFTYPNSASNQLTVVWESAAVEQNRIDDRATMGQNLYKPADGDIIYFNGGTDCNVEDFEIMTFLNNSMNFTRPVADVIINDLEAQRLNSFFKNRALVSSEGVSMVVSNAMFFTEDDDDSLDAFRMDSNGTPMTHFRYFFGFSEGAEYGGQHLRVILIGVDQSGRNLIGNNALVLQKSWPPSPQPLNQLVSSEEGALFHV
jgi:hypothetical protein